MTPTRHGASRRARCWAWATATVLLLANTAASPLQAADPSDSGHLNWQRRGSQGSAVTQHNLTIAQPLPSHAATAPPTGTDNPSVTVLRWRTSGVSQTQVSPTASAQSVRLVTVSTGQAAPSGAAPSGAAPSGELSFSRPQVPSAPTSGTSYPVRQVAAHSEDLPVAIPDSTVTAFDQSAQSSTQTGPELLRIEPAMLLAQQPAPPAAPAQDWQDDPPPQPLGGAGNLPQDLDQLLPSPPDASSQQEAPCQKVYNQRDCCADADRCDKARDVWARDAIARISLDITPSMHPGEKDPVAAEEKRNRALAQSPIRLWRDRQGTELAEGRLTNIQRGQAMILNGANQIVRIPFNTLSDDDLCFLTAWWNVPNECTLGDELYAGRNWMPTTMTWKASALCHKPLYFEQVQLERYGHTAGPIKQPLLSGAHFFTSLVALPYQAGINPPWECQYSLGYYRPGSCAPWMVPPVPLSVRGGLLQAGAVVGGVAIFP